MSAQLFLITFDQAEGHAEVEELGTDVAAAMRTYKERERAANGADVVLLGSESLETLRKTHSSYFGTSASVRRALNHDDR